MAGGVDQVEDVVTAVLGGVVHADGGGFDGDAFFALQVHAVQDLLLHFAVGDGAGELQEAVGEGGFAVVYVGDDAEVADVALCHGGKYIICET